jgi:hypothetical protein
VKLRDLFRRRRFREGDVTQRSPDNTDALTTARANQASNPFGGHGAAPPPGWVKGYDEGRPRK